MVEVQVQYQTLLTYDETRDRPRLPSFHDARIGKKKGMAN